MILFLKGLIIGLGKIIPGVSGALLAINFNVYDKAISALVNFFDNWKKNLKFLFPLCLGIFLSIIFASKGLLYLLNNYKFLTLTFFIGLICGGTYNFSREVKYNFKNISIILILILALLLLSIKKVSNIYLLKNNLIDNLMFFLGGIVEIFASIIPGISGTSILMLMGIYDHIILMVSKLFDFSYVIKNSGLYLSYGLGMLFSLIFGLIILDKLLKKHRNKLNVFILGFCIYSILMLFKMAFSIQCSLLEIILGIVLFALGSLLGVILDK